MRISIPNIPLPSAKNPAFINPLADITHADAVGRVKRFLDKGKGKTLVLTGAGVSVDSGIRAYRGTEGHCESLGLEGPNITIALADLTSCLLPDTQNPNFRWVVLDAKPEGAYTDSWCSLKQAYILRRTYGPGPER
jgi:hypothetical protein